MNKSSINSLKKLKVALVYDRVNKYGGAERLLLALHQIFPQAPLYTLVYNPKSAVWADCFKVIPSFFNSIPLLRSRHELLAPLSPLGFESFDFSSYDIVISLTSESAKSILTQPQTFHLCYSLTPTRYLFSHTQTYQTTPGLGLFNPLVKPFFKLFSSFLTRRDLILSHRPDSYFAISRTIKSRLTRFYHQDSQLIYPPIDYQFWSQIHPLPLSQRHQQFLVVSRLVPYKKVDLVVRAFSSPQLQKYQLHIVGTGSQQAYLKSIATPNITFHGHIDDHQLRQLYTDSLAFIFPQLEDFGLTPLESQAAGTPVIAFNAGGATETVIPGKTGLFFDKQTSADIIKSVQKFLKNKNTFKPRVCQAQAKKFSIPVFTNQFTQKLSIQWQKYQKNLSK